jgi:hypothetical protein
MVNYELKRPPLKGRVVCGVIFLRSDIPFGIPNLEECE